MATPPMPEQVAAREPEVPEASVVTADPIGQLEAAGVVEPVRRVRWGVLGTANIARRAFLPALHQLGGTASVVASRDADRATAYAEDNGIARAVGSYEELIEADDVDVVYNPLPNTLHAEWTAAALRAGKPVLCEKPLTPTAAETADLIAVSESTGAPLWEAFVFLFAEQTTRLLDLCDSGVIGPITSIETLFDFDLGDQPDNIRLSTGLAGGALYDVGCYPIRLAGLLLGGLTVESAETVVGASGVDVSVRALLRGAGGVPVVIGAAIDAPAAKTTTIVGELGRIVVPDPFHPMAGEVMVVDAANTWRLTSTGAGLPFGPAIRHLEAVVRGNEAPLHLAADEALATAQVIDAIRAVVAS